MCALYLRTVRIDTGLLSMQEKAQKVVFSISI